MVPTFRPWRCAKSSRSGSRAISPSSVSTSQITAAGVSLTVNDEGRGGFGVNIVPHTLRHTTLGRLQPGDPVNLEVDLLARYLERLIKK